MARPRRQRQRTQSLVKVDPRLRALLQAKAVSMDVPLLTWLDVAISAVAGYEPPDQTLKGVEVLPAELPPLAVLQQRFDGIQRQHCRPGPPADRAAVVQVRIDWQLRQQLEQRVVDLYERADDPKLPFSWYLHAVLHIIAGLPLQGLGEQPSLDFTDLEQEGEVLQRQAS